MTKNKKTNTNTNRQNDKITTKTNNATKQDIHK